MQRPSPFDESRDYGAIHNRNQLLGCIINWLYPIERQTDMEMMFMVMLSYIKLPLCATCKPRSSLSALNFTNYSIVLGICAGLANSHRYKLFLRSNARTLLLILFGFLFFFLNSFGMAPVGERGLKALIGQHYAGNRLGTFCLARSHTERRSEI